MWESADNDYDALVMAVYMYTEPKKTHTKMFLSYFLQNLTDSDNILYILC